MILKTAKKSKVSEKNKQNVQNKAKTAQNRYALPLVTSNQLQWGTIDPKVSIDSPQLASTTWLVCTTFHTLEANSGEPAQCHLGPDFTAPTRLPVLAVPAIVVFVFAIKTRIWQSIWHIWGYFRRFILDKCRRFDVIFDFGFALRDSRKLLFKNYLFEAIILHSKIRMTIFKLFSVSVLMMMVTIC